MGSASVTVLVSTWISVVRQRRAVRTNFLIDQGWVLASRARLIFLVLSASWMNWLRLTGIFPGDGFLHCGHLLVDVVQGCGGPARPGEVPSITASAAV